MMANRIAARISAGIFGCLRSEFGMPLRSFPMVSALCASKPDFRPVADMDEIHTVLVDDDSG